jgi:hypothetical protein
MYMTVLKADFQSLSNQKYPMNLNDSDFMHKWLTSQLDMTRRDAGLLYYIKPTETALFVYVQTNVPFPTHNVASAGMEVVQSFRLRKPQGDMRFVINCCPSKSTLGHKTRILETPELRQAWLINHLPGISVTQVRENRFGVLRIKEGVNVPCVEFTGKGFITDPNTFFKAVSSGIGRCKNYGAGLLLYKEI